MKEVKMNRFYFLLHTRSFRSLLLVTALTVSIKMFAVGWTPTDCGLVVKFERGDQFLLSVMVDDDNDPETADVEYFVCDYPTYSGGHFGYSATTTLKLIPQSAVAIEPSAVSIWTVDTALTRPDSKNTLPLGGVSYTMKSNTGKTLVTTNSAFKFLGALTDKMNDVNLCDVVFAVPTNRSTCADPNNTLGRAAKAGDAIDGQIGRGFLGMVYREVYWFDIPRKNGDPNTYTNASLVTFNTTTETQKWGGDSPTANNNNTVQPGQAAYAFADAKHNRTTRTLFRLYVLGDKQFNYCPSYFFGWNVQDYKKYHSKSSPVTDSTTAKKVYYLDHFEPMKLVREGEPFYQTKGMKLPQDDSTYIYTGKNNTYYTDKVGRLGSSSATPAQDYSQFRKIDNLRVRRLKDASTKYSPSKAAFGYLAIDTTQNEENLGIAFEPAGYFLRTSTGKNVAMLPNADRTIWTSEEMWTITEGWSKLQIKATLFTGPEFSEDDPGADIAGWSVMQVGTSVPVQGGGDIVGKSGWAQINVTSAEPNGNMVFIPTDGRRRVRYDYNGLIGVSIPDQYAMSGKNSVNVRDARLKDGFVFLGWGTTTAPNEVEYWTTDSVGGSTMDVEAKFVGDAITIPNPVGVSDTSTVTLYAKGYFNDTYRVAFSFIHPTDKKRYFLTHPNSDAPRFARARTFTDWTDVYQGMSDAENSEPNYLSTYKMIVKPTCELCEPNEVVLDPRHETVRGVEDSLTFYENWSPANDEFIGLYYLSSYNQILANDKWAGAFQSTEGWPSYRQTAVDSTKLLSTHYFNNMLSREGIRRRPRVVDTANVESDPLPPYIQYNTTKKQFDGIESETDATTFQITGIAVADAHYVILPDTLDKDHSWVDEVVFDYHKTAQHKQVWSKLIGKQLMAVLRVGPDTVYFHPNRDKIFTTASELSMSGDFRLSQDFTLIHDRRAAVKDHIAAGDSVTLEDGSNYFFCHLYSSPSTPIGPTVDIVDTLRVRLRPSGVSKIKNYYGRWSKKSSGVHVLADGSRYRDILIKTKTYHYGAEQIRLVLAPERAYNFNPMKGATEEMHFTLTKERYMSLLNSAGELIRDSVLSSTNVTSQLALEGSTRTLAEGTSLTICAGDSTSGNKITIRVTKDNAAGVNYDTLTVVIPSITIDGVAYKDVTAVVPVSQSSLDNSELIWSVKIGAGRRFITIREGNVYLRNYGTDVYPRLLRNKKELTKGSKNAKNDDNQYLTPWKYAYSPSSIKQLTLKTEYGVNKFLNVSGDNLIAGDGSEIYFTYEFVTTNTNDNGNYEEKVKLKFGSDQWVKVNSSGTGLELTTEKEDATVFSWSYLLPEYNLLNNGRYPSVDSLVYARNNLSAKSVQTSVKAYREYSMLLDGTMTHVCKVEETNYSNLTNSGKEWLLNAPTYTLIPDDRDFEGFPDPTSGFSKASTGFTTTITPSGSSPTEVKFGGKYVDIVDTLQVTLSLQDNPETPIYRFTDWAGVSSLSDANLKIPLVRKTYHTSTLDTVVCMVEGDEYNFAFPSKLPEGEGTRTSDSCHLFVLNTLNSRTTFIYDIDNNLVATTSSTLDTLTSSMDLTNIELAEVRLVDEKGNTPDWCEIHNIGKASIEVKCTKDGIRSPRHAYIYMAYIVMDKKPTPEARFVNFRLTVSQASLFQYTNNQTLSHSRGYTGDDRDAEGKQRVHENKRILYYYNPKPYDDPDQNVELPVRERDFYGWWRWYREGKDQNDVDVSDTDIPDSVWQTPPRNVGKFNYPFRIIGDSVDDPDNVGKKKLVTMGRYTVFHYPSVKYASKFDPPAKNPLVYPPFNKDTVTYVVDLSNYYDNLPLSMANVNNVDTAMLDTINTIVEPTLSVREIFELHPWTEMAAKMDGYKSTYVAVGSTESTTNYMEDHVVMAPTGHPLLLSTEQRYRYDNLVKNKHSESLLGYYMRDDHWSDGGWNDARKDTMIWCGGWDADCEWYIYTPTTTTTGTYALCDLSLTESDDFLKVPAKGSISGDEGDTVYYCLRSRSKSTTRPAGEDVTDDGVYWFNICRYKVIYHNPNQYGPLQETGRGRAAKAIITDDEIEQNYEVLERLNFDYYQPGSDYHVYPRPLPWADASYGYSYPAGPEIPDNRYHNDFAPNFPGPGEYGIINRIPVENFSQTYWNAMEQHGGAENGYMIYCDGMSSAGQVAALSLSTHLCEGQRMYFSAYVGNPSTLKENKYARPNFTFSVQGWDESSKQWEDITTYMTGDIEPSDKWSQIYFPINPKKDYEDFRVRIYNMASSADGNDFIIDDMCIFATKPPLIAYQANTKCMETNENDSVIQVVLRVDYQGFTDKSYNNDEVTYTVVQVSRDKKDTTFVPMIDGYVSEEKVPGGRRDTIYGAIRMPAYDYVPQNEDSVYASLNELAVKFESTWDAWDTWNKGDKTDPEPTLCRQGYIYENLDGNIRPVLYTVHKAKMTPDKSYTVRMSLGYRGLMSSECAMTSELKVTSRMMLVLNGEEQEEKSVDGICANTIYDLSMRVHATVMNVDSVAPIDLTGSCYNDWLLYGDTAEASSVKRYGYKFSDIEKVVRHILRYADDPSNSNIHAHNLGEVNRNMMQRMQTSQSITFTTPGHTSDHPYDILADLVNKGFLSLYQSDLYVGVSTGDSIQYVVFPILGTGSDEMNKQNIEICPVPIVIKLKPKEKAVGAPMMIGGIKRDSTQANQPISILADAETANKELLIHVDSIRSMIGVHAVTILHSDDPDFRLGVHKLALEPNKVWPRDISSYYKKGDNIILKPASTNNYAMRPGYNYTFTIEMTTATDSPNDADGCPVGDVPLVVSIVPDYLRWSPTNSGNNRWNDPMNWIGVTAANETLPTSNRFAPLPSTDIIIPEMADGLPYPELQGTISPEDSVKQVGFVYNTCDDIRFLAGAAIGQQQLLTSDVLVVDMRIQNQTWTLRSAPVTGMISGDLYMADADLSGATKMWSVGVFDASGRSWKTGNASFWLSLYNKDAEHLVREGDTESITAAAEWSKVTNGMTLSLAPAQGWAVYTHTAAENAAEIRLPKNDDVFYYYGTYGERLDDRHVDDLRAKRDEYAEDAGSTKAGEFAFNPGKEADHQNYTLTNTVASNMFVFGNPTLGYIDIWGFISDNGLKNEFDYLDAQGKYRTITKASADYSYAYADSSSDVITNQLRYLPPMHAIVVKLADDATNTSKSVTVNTNRIVTQPLTGGVGSAPVRRSAVSATLPKGIMTVTAVNSVSDRCVSRLLLGQGYDDAIRSGEDAILTTLNIDKFHMTNTPTTPFNIYAIEDAYGLSIDLRRELVNVPISFYMSELPYAPVTQLWFTGVNTIDGSLVLYDALTDTERAIFDGIYLNIETPEANHEKRYYIRRRGFNPNAGNDSIATDEQTVTETSSDEVQKILRHGQVLIIRSGHVYNIFGQKIR